jgi:hypothetical protein
MYIDPQKKNPAKKPPQKDPGSLTAADILKQHRQKQQQGQPHKKKRRHEWPATIPPGGWTADDMTPSRDYGKLYPAFADKVELVEQDLNAWAKKNAPDMKFVFTGGFRKTRQQQYEYAKGRIVPSPTGEPVTHADGIHGFSNHQSALAADFSAVYVDGPKKGTLANDDPRFKWGDVGHLARSHGLAWGGAFKKYDPGHVQWHPDDTKTYDAAKKWIQAGFPPRTLSFDRLQEGNGAAPERTSILDPRPDGTGGFAGGQKTQFPPVPTVIPPLVPLQQSKRKPQWPTRKGPRLRF